MKILLIAFYFAPLNKIAAIRPAKLCKYWIRQGHDVVVLTADNETAYPLHDIKLQADEFSKCRIIRTKYISRTLLKQRLQKSGSDQEKAGVAAGSAVNNDTQATCVSLFQKIILFSRNLFNEENISWYLFTKKQLRDILSNERFDMIFSTFGPMNCHRLGLLASRLQPKAKWIADFRDPYSGIDNLKFGKVIKALMRRREIKIYQKADGVTFVSQGISDVFQQSNVKTPCRIITNGFDPEDKPSCGNNDYAKHRRAKLKIVYTGSIYPHMQDPAAIFNALNRLISDNVIKRDEIQLAYAGYHSHILKAFAKEHGLDNIVDDHGVVTRDQSLALQMSADLLLLITANRQNRQGVLTGKFFEYMMCGKPIVAIVNGDLPDSEISRIIRKNNLGFVWEQTNASSDNQSLADYIHGIVTEPVSSAAHSYPDGIHSYEYSRLSSEIIDFAMNLQ